MKRGQFFLVFDMQQIEEMARYRAIVCSLDPPTILVLMLPLVDNRGNDTQQRSTPCLFCWDVFLATVLGGMLPLTIEGHACPQHIHWVAVFGHELE